PRWDRATLRCCVLRTRAASPAPLVPYPTLFRSSEAFEGARTPMPRPEEIDRRHAPADILAPLPADSSQLAAVVAAAEGRDFVLRSEEHTSELQSRENLVCRLLLEKKTRQERGRR